MNNEVIDGRFLQTCDISAEDLALKPFTMVIFGGNGDLSRRKLIPTLFHLSAEEGVLRDFVVLGLGRKEMDDGGYREMIREATAEFGGVSLQEDVWDGFGRHLYYLAGPFESDETYTRLRERIDSISIAGPEGEKSIIYYLAVPPHITPVVVEKLQLHGLSRGPFEAKIVIEKPFGRDRLSAISLNSLLSNAFEENRIYRIDHYLGKDQVQNVLFLRFSNSVFEQFWNCRYIDNVQITVSESLGIEHRGAFYEETGIVRDIIQNHMLQLIGLVAMEPPVGFQADLFRDEMVKIFRSVRPVGPEYIDKFMVRGQYGRGPAGERVVLSYREEGNVSPVSNVPTFIAGKFYIDNLRWAGVPFYVRAGKRLAGNVTEICIQFKRLPLRLFGRTCDFMEPNVLFLTVQPEERIALRFNVKHPHSANQVYAANMVLNYRETFRARQHPAYERLLSDCIRGDLTLFVRQDAVEATWEIVDPIVSRWESIEPQDFPNYAAGSWGPAAAHHLLEQDGRYWITDLNNAGAVSASGVR